MAFDGYRYAERGGAGGGLREMHHQERAHLHFARASTGAWARGDTQHTACPICTVCGRPGDGRVRASECV
eukprot:5208607-Pleurochrysis_carterae.AAC.4